MTACIEAVTNAAGLSLRGFVMPRSSLDCAPRCRKRRAATAAKTAPASPRTNKIPVRNQTDPTAGVASAAKLLNCTSLLHRQKRLVPLQRRGAEKQNQQSPRSEKCTKGKFIIAVLL